MKFFCKLVIPVLFFSLVLGMNSHGASMTEINEGIIDAIKAYIVKYCPELSYDTIKAEFKYADSVFKGLLAREKKLSFEVTPLYLNFKPAGSVLLPLNVFEEGKLVDKIHVRTRIEVIKNVIVASKSIKRGETVKPEDISIEPRDISKQPKYFVSKDEVVGKETTTLVMAKAIVEKAMLRDVPLVKRNQAVDIVAFYGNLRVKASGRSLEDGYKGQVIKVINLNTKKRIDAAVLSSTEVEARLK